MTPDAIRFRVLGALDRAIARHDLLPEDRPVHTALRAYVQTMTDEELKNLFAVFVVLKRRERPARQEK